MIRKLLSLFRKAEGAEVEDTHEDDESQERVYFHSSVDSGILAANQKARDTFRYFWREMVWERRRIIPGHDLSCVKFPFSDDSAIEDDSTVEQMWVDNVDFDGTWITGTLVNSPNWLQSISTGDPVRRTLDELSDWMFAIDGRAHGAFTVNQLRSQMSPQELDDHDSAWGLDFGDPHEARLVYGSADLDEASLLRDHPMAVNGEPKIRGQLKASPEYVHEADERGWTALHHEALAGNRNIVQLLLEFGADREAKTDIGQSATDLAAVLSWHDTVEVLRAEVN